MERKQYIDCMRGIAAILVVAQHTLFINSHGTGELLVSWFHNPVFFIASGVLLYDSLKNRGGGKLELYFKKFLTLIIPFIIWNIIDTLICIGFKQPVYSLAANAIWFLAVLFAAQCAIITVKDISHPVIILAIFAFLFAGMTVGAFFASFLAKVFTFTFIVYLGFNIERSTISRKTSIIINIILLLFLGGFTALTIIRGFTTMDGISPGIPLILSMMACIISSGTVFFTMKNTYDVIAKTHLTAPFCLIGQYTLQIYLLPFPLTYILQLFTSNPYLHFFVSLAGALLIGFCLKGTVLEKILFKPAQLFMRK